MSATQPLGHATSPSLRDQAGTWLDYLRRARQDLEAAGAAFVSGAAIAAYVDELRGETERIEGIYWEKEWSKHHGDSP